MRTVTKTQARLNSLRRGYRDSADVTTSSGFPVTVWMNIQKPDRSVGIDSPYVDDRTITTRNGCECEWLKLSEKEEERLEELAFEKVGGHDPYDFN